MTVQELINAALRSVGVLAAGETPSSDESADSLTALNDLIASWSAQALPIYQITRSVVALTGAQSYALGDAVRPVKIKAASVLSTAAVEIPLMIANAQQWAAYMDKPGTADFGELLFYEDGYPLGKIHMAPKSNGSLNLISEKPIGTGVMQARETLALTGAVSYTIGAGGTFNVERPSKILAASIAVGSSITKPLHLATAEEWAAYPKKGAGGNFAEILYYDNAYPSSTLYLAPIPATGGTLELFSYMPLSTFASVNAEISLPPGYERALRLALAVELAPEFGRPLDAGLAALANDAKMSVFGLNAAILGTPAPGAAAAPPPTPPPTEVAQ